MKIDVDQIRQIAAMQAGERALEERFSMPKLAAVDVVLLQKAASADFVLLGIATSLNPHNPLASYEELGGTYGQEKTALTAWKRPENIGAVAQHLGGAAAGMGTPAKQNLLGAAAKPGFSAGTVMGTRPNTGGIPRPVTATNMMKGSFNSPSSYATGASAPNPLDTTIQQRGAQSVGTQRRLVNMGGGRQALG